MTTPSSEPNFETQETLLPVIAQDAKSGKVLMLAYMNRAAYDATRASGEAVYFSRSRNALWHKGATSGNTQRVVEMFLDCDSDTILLKIEQVGGACHEGYESCFFRKLTEDGIEIVEDKVFDPGQVYGKKE